MSGWLDELRADLKALEAGDLLRRLRVVEPHGRWVRVDGAELLNLASNDYLGIAQHPRLRAAATAAAERWGTGAGASRLVTGHLPIHAEVEARFAAFKHAEAALLCPTGFQANLAVLTALARPGDLVCVDKLNHASLIDAAFASGAEVRAFPHLQYAKLERLLQRGPRGRRVESGERRVESGHPPHSTLHTPHSGRRFIVTDSIFSMDGDVAGLPALAELAERYEAILVVDEAHGTGVLGAGGAGLAEAQGVVGRVDVTVSTASKALGGLGGIVTARGEVIDTLVNHARAFIYTTAVPPGQAAVLGAALEVVAQEPWRRERLAELATRLRTALTGIPWLVPHSPLSTVPTPIIPLVVGAPRAALALSTHLRAHGVHAPAIRPPTVAPGTARVRLSLRADLEDGDLERLLAALRDFAPGAGP